MSDLIRRSDAVTEIHKYFVEEIEKTPTVIDEDGDELYADMTTVNSLLACNKELSKRIKALPSADAEWIPVSERLPENSGCVLISIAGDIEFGAYDRQNSDWAIWRDGYWDEGKRADAWMPLPEPYKVGDSE